MEKQVILLFPGQGAQYVGMGKNLSDKKEFFKKADKVLAFSLSDLCFNGPLSKLTLTENTQPAILTHSIACLEQIRPLLKEKKIKIERVMGHSVGEYSALVAAGVLSFEDAVYAVHIRGKFMQEASAAGPGKMVACMRVSPQTVRQACEDASKGDDLVVPANFNGPHQTVISGTVAACERAVSWLKRKERRFIAIELKVSAPFHSPLMKPAANKLRGILEKLNFTENKIGLVANRNAKFYPPGTKADIIRENLVWQMTESVLWQQSMEQLPQGIPCIESGPSKVLTGLAKKIDPERITLSLDEEDSTDKMIKILQAGSLKKSLIDQKNNHTMEDKE